MRKRSIAAAGVGLVVLAVGGVYGVGWQLTRPVPAHIGRPPLDLGAEPVVLESESGSLIRGWLSRGTPGAGAVLLLPAVRANRLSMLGRARLLRDAGYSTLSIDFQATGESPGDTITFGWRERLDVRAAVRALRWMTPGEPVGVIGVSLGGAAALLAGPSLDVQALVLEAVYPSIEAAVENRLRMRLGAPGVALAPLVVLQLRPRLGIAPAELRPVDRVGSVGCPVLVIGGALDEHTTLADTEQLYAAARPPKELWLVPGAAHVDYLEIGRGEYRRRVLAFLERVLRVRGKIWRHDEQTRVSADPLRRHPFD